jgi:hypothetical protein
VASGEANEQIKRVVLAGIAAMRPAMQAFRCRTGSGSLPTEPNTLDEAQAVPFSRSSSAVLP